MTTKIKIQLSLIAVLILIAASLILSQTATPDFPPLFALKRIQEKAFMSLKSNPKERLNYMRSLLNTRLDELDKQVKVQSYSQILSSASRYSTLAGEITDFIITNNLEDQVPSTMEQFINHKKVLREIYVIYPKNTENVEYKYIEDDINYLDIYLDKLSQAKSLFR